MSAMASQITGVSMVCSTVCSGADHRKHDDVIKWKHFPRNWPFVRGIHRSPVNSAHKGYWRRALMFSLICVWINGWVNNREAGDERRYRAHYDVTIMTSKVFVRRIHRWQVKSPQKGPVTRKIFPFDDVIMHNSYNTGNMRTVYVLLHSVVVKCRMTFSTLFGIPSLQSFVCPSVQSSNPVAYGQMSRLDQLRSSDTTTKQCPTKTCAWFSVYTVFQSAGIFTWCRIT